MEISSLGTSCHERNPGGYIAIPIRTTAFWVVFDWDQEGFQSFASDPETPAIMQEAGHKGKPQATEFGGRYDA